jgi:hypothetical protein
MNASQALEWLLENCVEEESEDAVDLKQEAESSHCLRRQQEAVASGKMIFDFLTASAVKVTTVSDLIPCGLEATTILEEYTAFILSWDRDMAGTCKCGNEL